MTHFVEKASQASVVGSEVIRGGHEVELSGAMRGEITREPKRTDHCMMQPWL